jgi:hypothetical protein
MISAAEIFHARCEEFSLTGIVPEFGDSGPGTAMPMRVGARPEGFGP